MDIQNRDLEKFKGTVTGNFVPIKEDDIINNNHVTKKIEILIKLNSFS